MHLKYKDSWVGGGRLQREGIPAYLYLIHVVQQEPTQYCKAIILQLKINILLHIQKKKYQVTIILFDKYNKFLWLETIEKGSSYDSYK